MSTLIQKRCLPCEVGALPLEETEVTRLLGELNKAWALKEGKLTQEFTFRDFKEAMGFVNAVAEIAEAEGHHPDMFIYFNKVRIELYTHALKGFSENDFILASKIEKIK